MKASDLFVRCLEAEGVERIFGVPGEENADVMISLDASSIDFILCRHEQAAAYMAFGYAQAGGEVGTALVVPGPGLLNASAGVGTAYAASSPVLLISGQVDSDAIGDNRDALHQVHDQLEF